MAQAGEIRISESTYNQVKDKYKMVYNGTVMVSERTIEVYQINEYKVEMSHLSITDNVSDLLQKLG